MVYLDLRVTAISDEDLKDFLIALRKIQYCGEVGANRTLPLVIDGDGSGQFTFEMKNGDKMTNIAKFVELDKEKLRKVVDGDDFDATYIGE